MAKARIVTPSGAEVHVDGTPEEIAAVLRRLKIKSGTSSAGRVATPSAMRKSSRTTLPGLIDELIEAKFFTKPKGMGEVKSRLADLGHHYPLTSLSGPLQQYVRKRKLRRFRQKGKYVYAQ